MHNQQILIVEDEVLIAESHKSFLKEGGYQNVKTVISVDKAIEAIETEQVFLVIVDINLFGKKTGIELGELLLNKYRIPFIYMTSYTDENTLDQLKLTKPRAYLTKPTNKAALCTTIDLVLQDLAKEIKKLHSLKIGTNLYNINLKELTHIASDHVYVKLHFTSTTLLVRSSLKDLIERLPINLVQVNRSVAVNPDFINSIQGKELYLNNESFKISKTYKTSLNASFLNIVE